ncbi:hypothetical protein MPSEU_000181800 [Mayamaea pseudoterrestris]|nr:hypothetical protein MPSEU_000181800 [Mayamaea pseudoterrestris]
MKQKPWTSCAWLVKAQLSSESLILQCIRIYLDAAKQLVELLDKCSLGTAVAIVRGPSGCGKTSLYDAFGRRLNVEPHEEWLKYVCSLKYRQQSENEVDETIESDSEQSMELDDIGNDEDSFTVERDSILKRQDTAIYISGQFDSSRSSVPYAAIVHAFNELGTMLCEVQKELDTKRKSSRWHDRKTLKQNRRLSYSDPNPAAGMRQSLAKCLNDSDLNTILELLTNEGKILAKVIPSFKTLVKAADPSRFVTDGSWGFSSTNFSLQLSKRSMGFEDGSKPIVLFGPSPGRARNRSILASMLSKGLGIGSSSKLIFQRNGAMGDSTSSNLASTLGMSMSTLSVKESEFASVTNGTNDCNSEGGLLTERFNIGISALLKVFCAPHRKLVWFLDDFQWADEASQQLIKTIVGDPTFQNLLVCFGYRNEVVETVTKPALEGLPKDRVEISLGNLERPTTDAWLASVLKQRQSESEFQLLVEVVHRKTDGNPCFVLQYLELLQRKGMLYYSLTKNIWEWDSHHLRALNNNDLSTTNALPLGNSDSIDQVTSMENGFLAELITIQMSSTPSSVQRLIRVASCLGFYFDASLLRGLCEQCDALLLLGFSVANKGIYYEDEQINDNGREDNSIIEEEDAQSETIHKLAMEQAEAEGLIERTPDLRIYKFAHDDVRKVIYESMAQGKERMLLHLRIGQYIMELGDERFILDAADHFNRGSSLLVYETERLDLIELNLAASAQAEQRAGIYLMADFLNQAILLVKERDWTKSYKLVLQVYHRSTVTEYARGDFAAARRRIQEILVRASTLDDQLPARLVCMEIFASQGNYSTAISESRKLLAELGEPLPRADQLNFALEYRKTRKLVQAMTEEQLLTLPDANVNMPVWTARILHSAASYGWRYGNQQFAELVTLRMMRFTLSFGSCELTPLAFAGYGVISANYGNLAEGRYFAELALRQIKTKSSIPAVGLLVHLHLSHLVQPAWASLEPLLISYRSGLEIGDLNFGALAIQAYASLYLFCGLPLNTYVLDMQTYCRQLRYCNQIDAMTGTLPLLQVALNLTGETNDAFDCSSTACATQQPLGKDVELQLQPETLLHLDYAQLFNAYVLNSVQVMRETARRPNCSQLQALHYMNIFYVLIDGLVHFGLYRADKRKADLTAARRAMKQIEWASNRSVNCLGLLLLLQAEKTSIKHYADQQMVKQVYQRAITELQHSGYVHFSAIANERAGEYALACRDQSLAEQYFSSAVELYNEWGATAKTKLMSKQHAFLNIDERADELVVSSDPASAWSFL